MRLEICNAKVEISTKGVGRGWVGICGCGTTTPDKSHKNAHSQGGCSPKDLQGCGGQDDRSDNLDEREGTNDYDDDDDEDEQDDGG